MKGAIVVFIIAFMLLLVTGWYLLWGQYSTNEPQQTTTTSQTSQEAVSSADITSSAPIVTEAPNDVIPENYENSVGIDLFASDFDFEHVKFDNVPEVSGDDEFAEFFSECLSRRYTQIVVKVDLTAGGVPTDKYLIKKFGLPYCAYKMSYSDVQAKVVFSVRYYTGEYVADAYLSGDTSKLDSKATEAYSAAKKLIDGEVAQCATAWDKALFIAEYICTVCEYSSEKSQAVLDDIHTIYGVLINGKANCQGFTDAFNSLCRMAGIETGKVSGSANGDLHIWSTMKIDNKWYMTDLTWMETTTHSNGIFYGSFCAGTDLFKEDHSWTDDCLLQNVVAITDYNYYYRRKGDTLSFENTFYDDIAAKFAAGESCVNVMASGFNVDGTAIDKVLAALTERGKRGSLTLSYYNLGKNGYVVANFT